MQVSGNGNLNRLYKAIRGSGSLRIACIYILVSLVWIFLSDRLLFLFKNGLPEAVYILLNSGKSFIFVIATGILLFLLIRRTSRQIVRNQNEYRELYEANPSPMWIYDPETLAFISVNETAVKVYGYTSDEFLNMTLKDIRPAGDHADLVKAVGRQERFQKAGIWRHLKKDGSLIHVDISSNRIRFRGRNAVMVLARDHSQIMAHQKMLKTANAELADEKKRLQDIQELSKIAAWDYFIAQRGLSLSDEVYQVFGVPKGLFEPKYDIFLQFIHRDDLNRFLVAARLAMTSGEDLNIVIRLFFGKQNIRYIHLLGKLEHHDGKPYKVRGTMQDITEMKLMEHERDQVNDENKRLDNIITKINNMVIIMDTESRITWVNKAYEDFTGYTPEDVMGLRPSAFMMGTDAAAQTRYINEAEGRREIFSVDTVNYTKNNVPYWVNIEFTPMFDGERFIGYITVHNNITTRKEKEDEIIKQNNVLKNIAWLSSHEIRRPAASILGLMYLIRDTNNAAEKEEYLRLLNDCTVQLDDIIHKINHTIYEELPEAR